MENLNEKQREAVNHKDGPILIIAGAGSGKTKTLTSRVIKLIESGVKPENILAITFTNKAAKEMTSRITDPNNPNSIRICTENEFAGWDRGPFMGTFHSFGASILKKECKLVERTPAFTIFDEDDSLSLIKKVLKSLDISKDYFNPAAVRGKISRVKSELLDSEEYLDQKTALIFRGYENALVKNNAFDFDDLIEKVVLIFKTFPDALAKYQNQFKYILVDEYQDVNTAQYQLIRLLAQKHQNLGVVGDDAQSIYRFRGSDFRNFLNFDNDWPNAKIVKLEQNYRSTANIIAAASTLIRNNKFQKPKELWTENETGRLVKLIASNDSEREAAWVAQTIKAMKAPILSPELATPRAAAVEGLSLLDPKSCPSTSSGNNFLSPSTAILYRTNAQSRAIEQELIFNRIPYKIFGGLQFYQRKEIKDIVAGLRLASNPYDSVSAERLEKTFPKATARHLVEELPRLGKELSILQLINFFLENSDYFDHLDKKFKNSNERIENINELITFAAEFKTLEEFLERVSLLQSADSPAKRRTGANDNDNKTVNLMTVHLSKGLEFDNVFVIGCNEGLLPHQMSFGSSEELEEERRLMYVAMTRAKKELLISFFGIPSRFLYEIPSELTEFINLKNNQSELPNEEEMYIE